MENYIPKGFDDLMANYLIGSAAVVEAVVMVAVNREPERYAEVAELLKRGRLTPRILSQPDFLRIALIDIETGESIGDIFQYTAPALVASGAIN